jgi:hypothetical protein
MGTGGSMTETKLAELWEKFMGENDFPFETLLAENYANTQLDGFPDSDLFAVGFRALIAGYMYGKKEANEK